MYIHVFLFFLFSVIDFDVLDQMIQSKIKDLIVMDVRNHSEIEETGKLPGSYCIPCKYIIILLFFLEK